MPIVLDTSFNMHMQGDPIMNTPADAYYTSMVSEMGPLVVGNLPLTIKGIILENKG